MSKAGKNVIKGWIGECDGLPHILDNATVFYTTRERAKRGYIVVHRATLTINRPHAGKKGRK